MASAIPNAMQAIALPSSLIMLMGNNSDSRRLALTMVGAEAADETDKARF